MKNAFVAIAIAIALMGCAMEEHEHEHEHIHAHPLLEHGHPPPETEFIDDGWVRLETGIVPVGYLPVYIREDRSVVVSHRFNGSLQRLILSSPSGHYCVHRHFVDDAGNFTDWANELTCYTLEELADFYELRLP